MNRYDYLMSKIEGKRGVKIDRETVYARGGWVNGTSSKTYRGGELLRDHDGKPVKGGKIENNTHAWVDPEDQTIVVRYHETQILRAYPDGIVVALSGYDSFSTRKRHKEYMASGWDVGSVKGKPFVWGSRAPMSLINDDVRPVILPFESGFVTGWNPSHRDVVLAFGCLVGDAEAADALTEAFDERAKGDTGRAHYWNRMGEIVQDWRGKAYGLSGIREDRKTWEALMNESTPDGLWLADPDSGVLVRAKTKKDEIMAIGLTDKEIAFKGESFDLVDGFTYSAK